MPFLSATPGALTSAPSLTLTLLAMVVSLERPAVSPSCVV
jgi:hypothetical protein